VREEPQWKIVGDLILSINFYGIQNNKDQNLKELAMNKKKDFIIGILFAVATAIFIMLFLTNDMFFNWSFERHHNILSWYIRPLFIIPMVIFAFKKSLTGIFASIFALFTSMFWFPVPATSNPQVLEFLAFEMDYLKSAWTAPKIVMSLAVPLFFFMLLAAAWNRNWKWLLAVIIGAAVLKLIWGIAFSGKAGISILKPALLGLIICICGLSYFFKKQGRL
jgi:membrane-associated HD superfamily phosphohydrolase